jgi:DNA-binding response OmpR family regulator
MPPAAQKKEKILIIDGNGSFGTKLADALRADGYLVFLMNTAADGLKSIIDIMPHLVILDLVVPGGDAYDILEKKQAEPLLSKIPVFLLSTQGVPINMRRVPAGSVTEFIVSLEPNPADIVRLADREFNHASLEQKTSDAAPSPTGKRVLWVEDDKLIGSILEKKFLSSGFDLVHTKNGEETFERISEIIPDAIVIDLILPGMSGFEILQKIRAMDGRLSKVPVMILSNLSKPSDIEKAKALGATKFMVKAASSLDQIVAEVKALLES